MGIFSTVLLVASIQGLFLSLVLLKKNWNSDTSNKILSIFIALITVTLWGRIFYEIPNKSIMQWKLLFIGDTILFLFGPILYSYIRRVFNQAKISGKVKILHFIPSLVFLISLAPLFLAQGYDMFGVYERLSNYYQATEFAAIIQLLTYFYFSFQIIKEAQTNNTMRKKIVRQVSFFRNIFVLLTVIVIIWLMSATVNLIRPPSFDLYLVYHLVWAGMAIIIYVIGYISMTDYSLIEIPKDSNKHNDKNGGVSNELELIVHTMEESEAYIRADITLQKFSDLCQLTPHEVSRILNEEAKMNFSEFVNKYRVNAFIQSLAANGHQNFTLLSLAMEVGFSSKTTFNNAFKRFTGITPSQYINSELNIK